ncbi:MAG: GNAT family N-acetyltransferase [Paracoccaceae bacterium]
MTPWPGLTTGRLTLRPWTTADAGRVHALVTRPEVARMLFMFRTDMTVGEVAGFIADWWWTGGLRFRCSIWRGEDWAGWIGVGDAPGDAPEPEIFYAIEDRHRGAGIAREAVAGFAEFLFRRFAVAALTAGVFTDNPASARVLERCGFRRVATVPHGSAGREGLSPAWVYRLARPKGRDDPKAPSP